VRPSGVNSPWMRVGDHPLLSDFLFTAAPVAPAADLAEQMHEIEMDVGWGKKTRGGEGEDEDVDMIPLIDISMVLLVFFIMIQAAGALAPVDVPEMRYAGELKADPDAVTITIEKLNTESVYYSVRVGNVSPRPEHDKLPTPEAAIKALNEVLVGVTRPPEVRIACLKELPRERVYELRRELEPLRKRGIINSTLETVVEAPEQK
jgi:biopolymer transport protein ExbD